MLVKDIVWTHPCGCGDTAHFRAEFQYSKGWLRVKKLEEDLFSVQKFGLDKMPQGEAVEMSYAELEALLS